MKNPESTEQAQEILSEYHFDYSKAKPNRFATVQLQTMIKPNEFPPGWNETRVQKVIAHYENLTEEEAVAEDEAASEQTIMEVPNKLVPLFRELIAKYQASTMPLPT